jgi:pyruvate/2-oxoglutarate dehydrogenase complex dihydrolipoamide dehydrogenase (E3) component
MRHYTLPNSPLGLIQEIYDLIAMGAGAGGLVSSKQSARRGAKSALISEALAGGDCLNVGCVPSKALIRAAKAVAEVKNCAEFGVVLPPGEIQIDFGRVMRRVREKRLAIAPADGHSGTVSAGAHVFQGRGVFTGPDTIKVGDTVLKFKKAVIATGSFSSKLVGMFTQVLPHSPSFLSRQVAAQEFPMYRG